MLVRMKAFFVVFGLLAIFAGNMKSNAQFKHGQIESNKSQKTPSRILETLTSTTRMFKVRHKLHQI